MPIYEIRFSDEFSHDMPYPEIKVKTPDGALLNEYQMSLDSLIECLIDAEVMEEVKQKRFRILGRKKVQRKVQRLVSPVLPKNCIRHIWLNTKEHDQLVFIEVPKKRWDIRYYDSPMVQIGFPRLIFGYRIKGLRCMDTFLLAVKEKGKIHGETELFKFPYANVANGKVCMGGNAYPSIDDVSQVATFHNLFFAAPSSNCFYDINRNHLGIADLRELYTKMQEQDFSDEWLVSKNKTFDQYCKSL